MQPTHMRSNRRSLIAALALLPLAACATPMGRYTVEQAVRRLLQLSSERAFARLTEPGGFYDKEVGDRLVKYLFAVRNAMDPAEAYRKFRGRDAKVDALMRDRGFPIPKESKE